MVYFFENRSHVIKDNIPLSIYRNNNFSYRAHWHTELELIYVESGSIWVCINNDRRKLVAGDLAISTSGDIHYYENHHDSQIILLIFKPEFFGLAADWPQPRQLASSFFTHSEIEPIFKNILDAILLESRNRDNFYELFIKSKVLELSASILRYLPTKTLNNNQANNYSKLRALQEILLYIENNFTEDISLQTIADLFKMDPFNLSKSFNSVTGRNLRTYINTLRVSKAKNLIKNTNKPLIEIAFECGFNSVRTFNRAYKNLNGVTPSSAR